MSSAPHMPRLGVDLRERRLSRPVEATCSPSLLWRDSRCREVER
jgi:hypothetical protein